MIVEILPGIAHGAVNAPPSKSFAHRMILCAALAKGKSVLRNAALSEDISATLDCISSLGAGVNYDNGTLIIDAVKENSMDNTPVFPCRESASTLRFFIPVSLTKTNTAVFTGTPRLMERGIGVYEELFKNKGISVNKGSENIVIKGSLPCGEYSLPGNISSQFISGLMFALPSLSGDSVISVTEAVESRAYIDITIDVLKRFGVIIKETSKNLFYVQGNQSFLSIDSDVEGDWSNSAFLYAFNYLGGKVDVSGLSDESLQGDKICIELFERLCSKDQTIDISDCPDLGPVLFAVAAAKNGAVFTGTNRLKIKESDRAQVMARELGKFGVPVSVGDNEVVIKSDGVKKPTQLLDGNNDHRIVMALSLLASLTGGRISCAEAVKKSYPDFFLTLKKIGLEVKNESER